MKKNTEMNKNTKMNKNVEVNKNAEMNKNTEPNREQNKNEKVVKNAEVNKNAEGNKTTELNNNSMLNKGTKIIKKIQYFSKDKMYSLSHYNYRRFDLKKLAYCFLIVASFVLFIGLLLINASIDKESNNGNIGYNEIGTADYTIFLKDNNYYDSDYLPSGSNTKYIASLIKTINAKFNYEIHSEKNIDLKYNYKIVGTLQIMDPIDSSKILYTKDEVLLNEVSKEENSNNLVINEDVIIDYGKYNDYVNAYKREYGLSVNSRLLITMIVDGISSIDSDNNKNSKLQISIPLSEQTIDIKIDAKGIDDSGYLLTDQKFVVNNYFFCTLGIIVSMLAIPCLLVAIKLFKEYGSSNVYNNTVNRILKDYDRLIVNGKVTIDESKYNNIVIPETFEEMVDASQNLKSPILFYEVIKGEKCFFVITKDDTLYKYRLTKAYLERNELNRLNNKDK